MHKILTFAFLILSLNVFGQGDAKVFVFLNSKPDKAKISEDSAALLQDLHMKNIEKMVADNLLIVAGPFEGGGGIFIMNTEDASQAKTWLQSDPAIKANRWTMEYFRIDFKKGGACLAQPPYEMVTYNFTRVNYINDIANYKMNSSDATAWNSVTATDSVIMIGRFPQYDGGIIVQKGEFDPKWQDFFSSDQITFDTKKVWVALGSFCEDR